MKAISLGWGVQSMTLAVMAANGEIDYPVAVHSDTGFERQATYAYAEHWTPWLEARGVTVATVRGRNNQPVRNGEIYIPAYSATINGGTLRRQCTNHWKIQPLRRYLQAHRNGEPVELAIGISLDEWQRAKDADVKYITHVWPLLDAKMTRADCIAYLKRSGVDVPQKSSCTFCPYHNKRAWQEMKRNGGPDWAQVEEVDALIRNARPPFPLYLTAAMKPINEAVRIPEDYGATQMDMFDHVDIEDTPCDSGACFL